MFNRGNFAAPSDPQQFFPDSQINPFQVTPVQAALLIASIINRARPTFPPPRTGLAHLAFFDSENSKRRATSLDRFDLPFVFHEKLRVARLCNLRPWA